MGDILYMKMDQSAEINQKKVMVQDIAKLTCGDKNIIDKINRMTVLEPSGNGKQRYIVSVLQVIEMIHKVYPELLIMNIGETDCIVEIKKEQKPKKTAQFFKVAVVCLILFFGAGFSIMSFNNDVGINELFGDICKRITGSEKTGIKVLESAYSIGLAVGIIVFYNHFGAKKLTIDPTPIEVEMRTYESDINTTLIDEYYRNDGRLDTK